LKLTKIRMMQISFHIEEGTKLSERTSFPGRVSKERGIVMVKL